MKNMTKEQLIKKLTEERDLAIKQLNSIGVGLGDNMDHLKKALKKRIPQKVGKRVLREHECGTPFYCPECEADVNAVLFFGAKEATYCWYCGQALDWGEQK